MAIGLALAVPARAVEPGEALADPRLEARARGLSQQLRCVVCQNQSIDDSSAPLARDLRLLVRERLGAGDSDAQALDFIVARYGTFVLLKPPLAPSTWLLWLGPLALLLAAIAALWRKRQGGGATLPTAEVEVAAPLSAAEEARLRQLAGDDRKP